MSGGHSWGEPKVITGDDLLKNLNKDCVCGNVNGLAIMRKGRLVDVVYIEQEIERLTQQLEEAKRDAEYWRIRCKSAEGFDD